MKGITLVGVLLTAAYALIVVCIVFINWSKFSALEPNAWGDFLAGSVGPLALFWIVLSFFLQGRELRNSIEALHLQTDELKASVQAQSELARSSTQQSEFQAHTREADLWLEVRKAELDIKENLKSIEDRVPLTKKSRLGTLSAAGMFKSGAREKFEREIQELEANAAAIKSELEGGLTDEVPNERKASVFDAALVYDLKARSSHLLQQLSDYAVEDQLQSERRYQESRRPNPPIQA